MRGLNLKEIMSKSNMNQQGLNIATYGQAYIGDEDAAEFLTFLISRDDINFEEIKINLLEILMASIETV